MREECTVERIECRAKEGVENRAGEEEKRKSDGRTRGEKKETDNRSRLARPGRASTIATFPGRKTDPEPRSGRSDCNHRRRVCIGERRGHERAGERTSERASERRGRARGSERPRCARVIFRPRKRSAWVSAWIPRSRHTPRRAGCRGTVIPPHVNGQSRV